MNAPNNHARPPVACAFVCAHANALFFFLIHEHPPCVIVVCHADVVAHDLGLVGSDTDQPPFFSLASTRRPAAAAAGRIWAWAIGGGGRGGRHQAAAAGSSPSAAAATTPQSTDRFRHRTNPVGQRLEEGSSSSSSSSSTQAAAGSAAGRTPSDSLKRWQHQLLADRVRRGRSARGGRAHTKAARGVGGGLKGRRRRRRRRPGGGWIRLVVGANSSKKQRAEQ